MGVDVIVRNITILLAVGVVVFICTLVIGILTADLSSREHLDIECSPKGLVSMFIEWWNPVKFWSAQLSAIEDYMERSVKDYQIEYLVRQKEREKQQAIGIIEQRYREEIRIILGLQPSALSANQWEEVEKLLAENNQFIEEMRIASCIKCNPMGK